MACGPISLQRFSVLYHGTSRGFGPKTVPFGHDRGLTPGTAGTVVPLVGAGVVLGA